MHPDCRAFKKGFRNGEGIVRCAFYGCRLDQVFCVHPVTTVAYIVAPDAAGGRKVMFPAVEAFHLLRFREVFEVCTANEAASGRGHEGLIGEGWR
jgi:hypothetical protein